MKKRKIKNYRMSVRLPDDVVTRLKADALKSERTYNGQLVHELRKAYENH